MPSDRDVLIGLNLVAELTPRRASVLLHRFDSLQAVWRASSAELSRLFGSRTIGEAISSARDEAAIREAVGRAEAQGVRIVALTDPDYPSLLREIDDPPLVLYVLGRMPVDTDRTIAIVGTGRSSQYRRRVAAELAGQAVSSGLTVVSDLAVSVNRAAVAAALQAGGHPIVVMEYGIDAPQPPAFRSLFEETASKGTVMSEHPLGTPKLVEVFPFRNRIISGISRGLVAIQATDRPGGLIAARVALEQNREVFAVPGNITSRTAAGPNRLIKQGAKLVTTMDDVLAEFPDLRAEISPVPAVDPLEGRALDALETAIYESIGEIPSHFDAIVGSADVRPSVACHILALFEGEGLIEEAPAGYYIRRGGRRPTG